MARVLVALLSALGAVRPAAAGPCVELCPDTSATCVVGNLKCDAPAIFDLGGRPLVIGAGKMLQVIDGALVVTGATSVTMEAQSTIRAQQVAIVSAGPVTLSPGSGIDVSSPLDGGYIEIEAQAGALTSLGGLRAKGGSDGEGGEVFVSALAGDVTIGGDGINCSASGEFSGGGTIAIAAAGDVFVRAPLAIGGGDAGEVLIEAEGTMRSDPKGIIQGIAATAGGLGASSTVLAGRDVQLTGKITASAPGNQTDGGGLGGELLVVAESGSVDLAAQVTLTGDGPDGEGGSVYVSAGLDVTVSAPVSAAVIGSGSGGTVSVSAGRFASFSSLIDARAGDIGGAIALSATDALTILGTLRADASSGAGIGGNTALRACSLTVLRGALISATGAGTFPSAGNRLESSGRIAVHGSLLAGDRTAQSGGRNLLVYRTTEPAIGPGAVVAPRADLLPDTALACCGDECPAPSTTTTSVSVPSSTSVTSTSITPVTTVPTTSISISTSTTEPSAESTSTTSTTTTPPRPSTTSTFPPARCQDRTPESFDVADCHLAILSDIVNSQSAGALGGERSARMLRVRAGNAQRFLAMARDKAKRLPVLRRARKQLRAFRILVQRDARRRRIDPELARELLDAAGDASASIDGLR